MYALLGSGIHKGLQYFTYPVLVAAGLGAHFLLLDLGVGHFAASTIPVLGCLAFIWLFEIILPYRKEWNANLSDIKTDFLFLVFVQGIAPKIIGLVVALLLAKSGFEPEALDGIWPKNWNVLGQTLLLILLADLLRYGLHVAAHKVPMLWKFHAIHHQPKKLYSINVARFHPAEKFLQFLFDTLPFILLGVSAEVIACYFVFYAINGFIQHSNINLKFGFLNYIISSCELHRWHHDEKHAIGNCNYGNNLIVWDLLFGSYYLPRHKATVKVGIKGVEPAGFLDAIRLPYKGAFSLARVDEKLTNFAIVVLYKLAKIKYWWQFKRQCEHPQATQKRLLKNILATQSTTTFGKIHGFSAMKSYSDYRRQVAVQNYESLRPMIEKQARYGRPEITSEPAILYAQTSGSTGSPKYIPVTGRSLVDLKKSQTISSLMMHQACPAAFKGKIFGIVSPAEEGYNEWGKPCGSASGIILRNMPGIIRKRQLLPLEVFAVQDCDLKYDLITLFALAEENISLIATANPSTLLRLLKLINSKRHYYLGILSARTAASPKSEAAQSTRCILAKLHCHEKRLAFLKGLFSTKQEISFGDLWKNLSLVVTWTGGSCGIPLDAAGKGLPEQCQVMELGYVASEFRGTITHYRSQLGIPTLFENFLEFVEKEDRENGIHRYLQLHEIARGRQYYIFVTNMNGLYRYDMNDIVEVSGYFKKTACLRFIQKGKGTTNITGEKLYEAHLMDAVKEFSTQHALYPVFYVCLANEKDSRYDLYLEASETSGLDMEEIASDVDSSLAASNLEYQAKRASKRLNRLQVKLLAAGSYESYKQTLVKKGQRESQFKVMTLQYARENHFPFHQHLLGSQGA